MDLWRKATRRQGKTGTRTVLAMLSLIKPRHDSIFLKSGKNLVRRLIKVRDYQRRVIRKSSEERVT
eukprot:9333772-Heterocapsa_arctica.AAC.1